jgi:hypothetical protein
MKLRPQNLILTGALFLLLLFPSAVAAAAGSFHVYDFPTTQKAVLNQPYSIYFNFEYSGASFPDGTLTSASLPPGMSNWKVSTRSAYWSGTPTIAGTYRLTLVLKDQEGALATKDFTFTVVSRPIQILTQSLPPGVVGQPYSATITFSWVSKGSTNPQAQFMTNLPAGLNSRVSDLGAATFNHGTATVEISGTPTKSGTTVLTFEAREGGVSSNDYTYLADYLATLDKKNFTLTITDPAPPPSPTPTATPPTVPPPTPPAPKPTTPVAPPKPKPTPQAVSVVASTTPPATSIPTSTPQEAPSSTPPAPSLSPSSSQPLTPDAPASPIFFIRQFFGRVFGFLRSLF